MIIEANAIYFIARRWHNIDGIGFFSVVVPKSGERGDLEEKVLQVSHLTLGDFFRVVNGELKKTFSLTTDVRGDVAYISKITSKLVNQNGTLLFQNQLFADSICRQNYPLGDYNVTISLLPGPHTLPSGQKIQFEATQVTPFSAGVLQKSKSSPVASSSSSSGGGSGEQISVVQVPELENAPQKEPGIKIEGTGFKKIVKPPMKCRAVVLNALLKGDSRMHFLWILDNRSEAIFFSKTHDLQKGHFFEGLFQYNSSTKKWSCSKYLSGIPKPVLPGGIDESGRVWFSVKLSKYQDAGINMRFSSGNAKYIGEILDTDSKLKNQDGNGKQVKIQRKPIDKNEEYVWAIIEVL